MSDRPVGLNIRSSSGFTLIELVIVIVVLGIMAGVAIPVIGTLIASSKQTATKEEMRRLARAIAGSDRIEDRGFVGDVGFYPSALADLVSKPDSVASWNAYQQLGWNGPYIDDTDSEYLTDAWGVAYIYDPAAQTIASVGSGDTITISF